MGPVRNAERFSTGADSVWAGRGRVGNVSGMDTFGFPWFLWYVARPILAIGIPGIIMLWAWKKALDERWG